MDQQISTDFHNGLSNRKQSDETLIAPTDSQAACRRLKKELMNLMLTTDSSVSAFPDGQNLYKWIGTINGPIGTVYEGLKYKLSLEFSTSYPYSAPVVKFINFCFHPNVDSSGNICLDILKEKWSALYDVRTILISIQSLLSEPNNDSPLNAQAAELWDTPTAFKEQLYASYKEQ